MQQQTGVVSVLRGDDFKGDRKETHRDALEEGIYREASPDPLLYRLAAFYLWHQWDRPDPHHHAVCRQDPPGLELHADHLVVSRAAENTKKTRGHKQKRRLQRCMQLKAAAAKATTATHRHRHRDSNSSRTTGSGSELIRNSSQQHWQQQHQQHQQQQDQMQQQQQQQQQQGAYRIS
ncbi:hypothetical protein Emag_000867 [Eimeria magna]